jgi:hypothetical protein
MSPNQVIDLIIEGTYVAPDAEEGTRLTSEEVKDVFWPQADLVLGEVAELLPMIAGYGTAAKLYVKWGTDDPVEDPIKLPATPTDTWNFTTNVVELYADQVRISPRGPQSGGAGDVVLWYSFTPPKLMGDAANEPDGHYTNQD